MIRHLRYLKNFYMTRPKKDIITIVGTTGVGKSQFSIDLAEAINGEIINADSMQMYKGLDQITNKHPLDERKGIEHHVLNHVNWNEEYNIHKFARDANKHIEDIHNRGKIPIIIGGTHYYLSSLLFSNKTVGATGADSAANSDSIKERELTEDEKELLDGPVENIFNRLKELDPKIAEKFHPQDKRKLRRALEIYYHTNKKTSDIYQEQKLNELEESSLKFNTLVFWVCSDHEVLKERLDKRVDKMMEQGAATEIQELYNYYKAQDPPPDMTTGIWQVIGYKEFLPWLESGSDEDFKEGVERMKIRTRQYAKSQIKWIKKLLATELNKESRFDFQYGGKMYMLDATDLTQWNENVFQIGHQIASKFLASGPKSVTEPQLPEKFKDIFPTAEFLSTLKSNKTLGSDSSWKHFTCDVCKKNGIPFVAVGEDSYNVHIHGRRHKRQVGANEKKRKHQEMIEANKRKGEEETSSEQ